MEKRRKKSLVLRQLRERDHDMAMQKKPGTLKTRPKRYKILRGSTKHGAIIQISLRSRSRQTASFRRAVERSITATQKSGNPVAKYDMQRRQAYLEYPEGTKAYVE